jgi:hypothetical protein
LAAATILQNFSALSASTRRKHSMLSAWTKVVLFFLCTSGSRELGECLLRRHADRFKAGGLPDCGDEEAPQAYKNIDAVIGDMLSDGLISVIATFRPLITYKKRKTT